MTRAEMVLEMVYSPLNHLTWLLAQEQFIEFKVSTITKPVIFTTMQFSRNIKQNQINNVKLFWSCWSAIMMTEKLCVQNSLHETRLNFVLLLSPFWKLFGCCVRSVTEGYIERMMARHSATLGSGAQARAGVIPLQSTASTDAPFSNSRRVTATMPFRDDRCSGLKHKHPLSVYYTTHCTLYLAQNTMGTTLLPLTPSKLTAYIMTINADGCSMRS